MKISLQNLTQVTKVAFRYFLICVKFCKSTYIPFFTRQRYEGQEPLEGDVLLVRGGLRGHGLLAQLAGAGHGGATGGAVEVTLVTGIDILKWALLW